MLLSLDSLRMASKSYYVYRNVILIILIILIIIIIIIIIIVIIIFITLQFFDHPIILDLMTERWYGNRRYLESSRPWWLFLNFWCLFEVVLFPFSFLIAFLLGKV